jgi:hypothetical protein
MCLGYLLHYVTFGHRPPWVVGWPWNVNISDRHKAIATHMRPTCDPEATAKPAIADRR